MHRVGAVGIQSHRVLSNSYPYRSSLVLQLCSTTPLPPAPRTVAHRRSTAYKPAQAFRENTKSSFRSTKTTPPPSFLHLPKNSPPPNIFRSPRVLTQVKI